LGALRLSSIARVANRMTCTVAYSISALRVHHISTLSQDRSYTGCVPERSANTISIGNTGTLQKSCSPGPAGHDCRRNKTRLDRTACSAEHFRRLQLIVVTSQNECSQHHAKGEQEAQANDHAIARSLAKRRSGRHLAVGMDRSLPCDTAIERDRIWETLYLYDVVSAQLTAIYGQFQRPRPLPPQSQFALLQPF
jgi:hypothetical protein